MSGKGPPTSGPFLCSRSIHTARYFLCRHADLQKSEIYMAPPTLPGVIVMDGAVYVPPPPPDDDDRDEVTESPLPASHRQHLEKVLSGSGDEGHAEFWQSSAELCEAIAAVSVSRGKAEQAQQFLRAAKGHRRKARTFYVSAAKRTVAQIAPRTPGRARSSLAGGRPAGTRRRTSVASASSGDSSDSDGPGEAGQAAHLTYARLAPVDRGEVIA
jgi:hypothetical protein